MERTGENLLTFVHNATSNMKTVLSRQGCFKRNTNHRRFLQKQLRQSTQTKNENNKDDEEPIEKSDTTLPEKSPTHTVIKPSTMKIRKTRSLRKRRNVTRPNPQIIQIPSPTTDYNYDYGQTLSHIQPFNVNMHACAQDSMEVFTDFPTEMNYSTQSTTTYYDTSLCNGMISPIHEHCSTYERWNSLSSMSSALSTSSSSDDESYHSYQNGTEYLSGEDLLQAIDICDLFISEKPSEDISTIIDLFRQDLHQCTNLNEMFHSNDFAEYVV